MANTDQKQEGPSDTLRAVVRDELLRFRVRKDIERAASSTWKEISGNPLVAIVLTFALTAIVGGLLTNYWQETSARRTTNLQAYREAFPADV